MGIAGAAPYSLVLIAGRELAFLHTRSTRFAGFDGCLDGAHHSAGFHASAPRERPAIPHPATGETAAIQARASFAGPARTGSAGT